MDFSVCTKYYKSIKVIIFFFIEIRNRLVFEIIMNWIFEYDKNVDILYQITIGYNII